MGSRQPLGRLVGNLHRDIKPDNLWLEVKDESTSNSSVPNSSFSNQHSSFRIKILDFGLARAAGDQANLTQSGDVMGTPSYLAPEQAEGRPVDARADLFSLGVVLYEMLTGKSPFRRDSVVATLLAIHSETPPTPPSLVEQVPPALSDLVMLLLEKEPEKRPASAHEVIRALRALDTALPVPAPVTPPAGKKTLPPRRALIATVAAAVALLIVATVITIIRNKDGKVVAKIEAPDGTTVETEVKPDDKPTPVKPAPITPAPVVEDQAEYLPPMSSLALVQRPTKLVSKDGEPVLTWTIATAPLAAVGEVYTDLMQSSLRPGGKQLATFGGDAQVRIWDLDFKRLAKVLVGHTVGPAWAAGNGS